MTYLAVNLLFRYGKQLGAGCLYNYWNISRIPEFNFQTYRIEQTYAYNLIKEFEKINDGITLSDIYHLIDVSLPFTKEDLTTN